MVDQVNFERNKISDENKLRRLKVQKFLIYSTIKYGKNYFIF